MSGSSVLGCSETVIKRVLGPNRFYDPDMSCRAKETSLVYELGERSGKLPPAPASSAVIRGR